MRMSELKDLTLQELGEKEQQLVEEEFNLRFQDVTGQLEKPSRIRDVRRTIARVKTLIRSKEKAGKG